MINNSRGLFLMVFDFQVFSCWSLYTYVLLLFGSLVSCTLLGTNISPSKVNFEDDFPFPKVGYVNSVEGKPISLIFFFPFGVFTGHHWCQAIFTSWSDASEQQYLELANEMLQWSQETPLKWWEGEPPNKYLRYLTPFRNKGFIRPYLREINWWTRCWQLKYVFNVHPENWGRWTHFDDHIFQMGWFNHVQPPTDKTWWMEGSDILENIGSDLERIIPRFWSCFKWLLDVGGNC